MQHKNYLDHVYAVTDDSGNLLELYRYTAFGQVETYTPTGQQLATSAIDNPVRWNSRRYDEATQLHYYKYRHYSPKLGRWLGRDPIEEDGGINLYAFVRNNVLSLLDYLGAEPTIPGPIQLTLLDAINRAGGWSNIPAGGICQKKPGERQCPNNMPEANGCGPGGWKGKFVPNEPLWLGDFTTPCDGHDICYGTCGNVKKDCDDAFLEGLKTECLITHTLWMAVIPPNQWQQRSMERKYKACEALAITYHAAVSKLGQKFYDAAQAVACDCCCEEENQPE